MWVYGAGGSRNALMLSLPGVKAQVVQAAIGGNFLNYPHLDLCNKEVVHAAAMAGF